ncbi:MAG: hypothetical protein DHS20C18_55280 [Saprospiraceae bacterium]|nr:MAG: hypothetical protein DHS20C18_55280 [Saprospiraceae bacterium]
MMTSKSITVTEAIKRLEEGKKIEGITIDFENTKVKALDAFKLGKVGIEVPDEVIDYDDADITYDPDFDDYEWERTDIDPIRDLKEKLTVSIEIDKDVKAWIQKNEISLDQLIEELIRSFYSANKLIKGK